MEVLREIWLSQSNTATIMITGVSDIDTAVEAMKLGASDYIVKPFELDRVDASIRTALETKQASSKISPEMGAIACGVEANLELLIDQSRIVTERTVDLARQLGIPEAEIQEWVAAKTRLDSERNGAIKSSLGKLGEVQSPRA